MVVRYAAEMATLEEGIAQANAAIESMAPVAAEMAASVDASFATMDEAVSNLVPALVDADGNIVLEKDICEKCKEELINLFNQRDYKYRW